MNWLIANGNSYFLSGGGACSMMTGTGKLVGERVIYEDTISRRLSPTPR